MLKTQQHNKHSQVPVWFIVLVSYQAVTHSNYPTVAETAKL